MMLSCSFLSLLQCDCYMICGERREQGGELTGSVASVAGPTHFNFNLSRRPLETTDTTDLQRHYNRETKQVMSDQARVTELHDTLRSNDKQITFLLSVRTNGKIQEIYYENQPLLQENKTRFAIDKI